MSLRKISVKDIYNLFPNNKIMDTLPLIKVELIVELSFETFGQVWYTDEEGRPWIKEFRGNNWSKEILLKDSRKLGFSAFLNNQFQEKGQWVKLIKKIDNEVVDQKEFQIDGDKLFEGWYKLG
jgi:hypothetical protein